MQAPAKQNFQCIPQKAADAQDQPIGIKKKKKEKSAARAMKGLYPRSS